MRISDWSSDVCSSDLLNPRNRLSIGEIAASLRDGAKYALAVGAAAATVGIVVGVVTLTGVGFKLSFIVTSTAAEMAGWIGTVVPAAWASPQGLTLLFTLVMTGIVCILMGRSEEHTSELQSLMRISYAVFCLKKKKMIHMILDISVVKIS